MTQAVADRETGWRQAIARGTSMPAATGIDDLISKLAVDRQAAAEPGQEDKTVSRQVTRLTSDRDW
jgi:hypothetical protein